MAEFRLRIDTSKDRAMEFIARLAEDDAFREELQADPARYCGPTASRFRTS